jgi:N-acylneuraminate cytidylyltransferase
MNYIALICARGGSKGLPDKNIRPLGGKPLISWSIDIAKKVDRISKVIVSTDSEGIVKIAKKYGAEVPFIRPIELAQDNSPEWLVWKHALEYLSKNKQMKIDALVIIPPTAPLRHVDDINNCLDEFEKGQVDIVITVSEAHRNPYFNMIVNNKDGYSSLVIKPESQVTRRQDAPVVFDMTTVAYVVRPQFLNESSSIFSGRVKSVCIPQDRAIDIDTLLDFKIAESLIKL